MEMYFHYLFVLVCSLAVVYSAGSLLLNFAGFHSGKIYLDLFSALFAGLVLTVLLTSLFFTKGKTVNIGLLMGGLIFFLSHYSNGKKTVKNKPPLKQVIMPALMLLLAMIIIFTLRFYLIDNHPNVPFVLNGDTYFYAQVSHCMGTFGIENINLDYLGLFPATNDPYHYFDIWFNTAIIKIFQLNSLASYVLITNTIFMLTCWCGFMALAEQISRVKMVTFIFSLLFIFYSGAFLPFYHQTSLLLEADVFTTDIFNYHKLVVVCLFMQAATLFFLNEKNTEGIRMLLLLPVVFISSAICIYTAVFCYLLIKYWRDRDFSYLLKQGLMMGLIAGFIFVFYTVGQPSSNISMRAADGGILSLLTFAYFKTAINIFGKTIIQLTVILLPVILVFMPARKDLLTYIFPTPKPVVLLSSLIFFFALFGWALMHYLVDSVQLFSNVTLVMVTLITFIILVYLDGRVSSRYKIMIYLAFCFVFFIKLLSSYHLAKPSYHRTNAYLNETSALMNRVNPLGVFMMNDSSYTNLFSRNPLLNTLGKHLAYTRNGAFTFSLSVYNMKDSGRPAVDKIARSLSAFYRFTEMQKTKGKFRSIAISQLEFIHTYQIGYLIAERGALLDHVFSSVITSEIKDPLSGERFCLLDYTKAGVLANQP